ncbi:hypothetical protein HY357_01315 [Candidatus Roizmanbacteria bacterium]|nr:hypothetical protein [Candidatus Roizmanbacteria bacterium]
MNEQKVICPHLYQLNMVSERVRKALNNGELRNTSPYGICDWMVPHLVQLINRQDIGCVGPNHPDCPDPSSAQIIPVGDIPVL